MKMYAWNFLETCQVGQNCSKSIVGGLSWKPQRSTCWVLPPTALRPHLHLARQPLRLPRQPPPKTDECRRSGSLRFKLHNCMAPADRAVVVFVNEFQWDQRYRPLQNNVIQNSTKIPVTTEVETQLFPNDLKCPQFKKKSYKKCSNWMDPACL